MKESLNSVLFEPDSVPFGVTIPEWIIRWWRWLLTSSLETNPASDKLGICSELRQDDPYMWFLAGTFGGSANRTCNVPVGRAILIPIINYECSFADEPLITSEQELELKCKKEIDDIKHLSVSIDGVTFTNLERYRVRSPVFSINLKENNILGVNSGLTKMITDGFWIFLKPLKIGDHNVTSYGSCRSGKIRIQTTYNLNIA